MSPRDRVDVPVSMDQCFVASPRVHVRRFDDETVLLDLAGGMYFALEAVGSEIFARLADGRPPRAIVDDLVAAFEVTRDRAADDTAALVQELLDRGLIIQKEGKR